MSIEVQVPEIVVLSRQCWEQQRSQHQEFFQNEVYPLTRAARHGQPHPVYDFLFDYYNFRPQQLNRWSPGRGVLLAGATAEEIPLLNHFNEEGGEVTVENFPIKRREGLDWVIELLSRIENRPAQHGCFGLHEWAMVYRTSNPRHQVPLRFSPEKIRQIVEAQPLVCTHFDAFRFFTPAAQPRNRFQLSSSNRVEHDQPGCIHANMDLYKWAYKFFPWISSMRIRETFQLARRARELDMRASPYDLAAWGFDPVKIETKSGREYYEQAQRELAQTAVPIRRKLLTELAELRAALTPFA